jgi:hypothetical protein
VRIITKHETQVPAGSSSCRTRLRTEPARFLSALTSLSDQGCFLAFLSIALRYPSRHLIRQSRSLEKLPETANTRARSVNVPRFSTKASSFDRFQSMIKPPDVAMHISLVKQFQNRRYYTNTVVSTIMKRYIFTKTIFFCMIKIWKKK